MSLTDELSKGQMQLLQGTGRIASQVIMRYTISGQAGQTMNDVMQGGKELAQQGQHMAQEGLQQGQQMLAPQHSPVEVSQPAPVPAAPAPTETAPVHPEPLIDQAHVGPESGPGMPSLPELPALPPLPAPVVDHKLATAEVTADVQKFVVDEIPHHDHGGIPAAQLTDGELQQYASELKPHNIEFDYQRETDGGLTMNFTSESSEQLISGFEQTSHSIQPQLELTGEKLGEEAEAMTENLTPDEIAIDAPQQVIEHMRMGL